MLGTQVQKELIMLHYPVRLIYYRTVQRIHEVVVRRALMALGAPYIIPLTLLMASEQ